MGGAIQIEVFQTVLLSRLTHDLSVTVHLANH